MPKISKTKIENNTFVKGLITEAGPLTFPDNASLVDENFVLNRDGSRQRRLGMSYENNFIKYNENSLENTLTATNSYTWRSVGNDGDLDIAVIQFGNKLYFFDNNRDIVTANILNLGLPYIASANTTTRYSFTESYGRLIIATGDVEVIVLGYDKATDTISEATTPFRLLTRDLFGVQESPDLEDDVRPEDLSPTHHYNLKNQGWPEIFPCLARFTNFVSDQDPIAFTKASLVPFPGTGVHPSNVDTIWLGKTNTDYGNVSGTRSVGSYDVETLKRSVVGSGSANKGNKILDLFSRGDSRAEDILGLPTDITAGGVSSVASYAGRIFYALREDNLTGEDDRSPDLSSMIMFSQNTNNVSSLNKCYSKNDPTAEDLNDILDTDGGFITIPDVGTVYRLEPLGESLFVFASKGVWEINGGDNYFSATSQSVTKTTDFGVISGASIVAGETAISFWSPGGIYSVQIDPSSLKGIPVNLTQNTIQSFYDDIPSGARADIAGVFDDVTKQVRWLYRDVPLPYSGYYNKELIYDLNLQAFYTNTFKSFPVTTGTSSFLIGYLDVSLKVFTDQQDNVVIGPSNNVVILGDPLVITARVSDQGNEGSTKYWAVRDNGDGTLDFTVSLYRELDFIDWVDEADTAGVFGVDSEATLLTGFTTDGAAAVSKKLGYFTLFMKRTESGFTDDGLGNLSAIGESSCLLRGQWDWTNSIASGRWSDEREVYRLPRFYTPVDVNDPFDYGFTVVETKNKIRGKGGALSLLFRTSPKKDLHIYGWSREVLVESN